MRIIAAWPASTRRGAAIVEDDCEAREETYWWARARLGQTNEKGLRAVSFALAAVKKAALVWDCDVEVEVGGR